MTGIMKLQGEPQRQPLGQLPSQLVRFAIGAGTHTGDAAYSEGSSAAEDDRQMRDGVGRFLKGLLSDTVPVRSPKPPAEATLRGEGHFHLVPELFLQISGTTRFIFPHDSLDLGPGEAMVVPPRMLHDEYVMTEPGEAPFCNVVIYADGNAFRCHVATEFDDARPGVHFLKERHHAHAPRIHEWLADAARLAWEGAVETPLHHGLGALAASQVRALMAASCAGVLRILATPEPEGRPEPPLVTRVRLWVQCQLGEHGLSVQGLADQAGCTSNHLSSLFSKSTGEQLSAYINRQRIERAARLLVDTKMAGKEVAWACGFATPSYFIRTFRAHFGSTPKVWCTKREEDLGAAAPKYAQRRKWATN